MELQMMGFLEANSPKTEIMDDFFGIFFDNITNEL